MLLFPLLMEPPPPPPLPVDVVRLLLNPDPPVPLGGAPAEEVLGMGPPEADPLADDAVVDAWLCDPFAIASLFVHSAPQIPKNTRDPRNWIRRRKKSMGKVRDVRRKETIAALSGGQRES